MLINAWFDARETALARVRAVRTAGEAKIARFKLLLIRAQKHVRQWQTDDAVQTERIAILRRDLRQIAAQPLGAAHPWHALMNWAERNVSMEAQEMLVSLLLEPYPELVDDLGSTMTAADEVDTDPLQTVGELRALIEREYAWALKVDFDLADNTHWFWYVSEEKLEPRIGVRADEAGADKELPLGVARDVQKLHKDLLQVGDQHQPVAHFLSAHAEHSHVARRVQSIRAAPYSEIRDNLLARDMRPIDLLRSKLSFFGATKFDPRSDRWTRIAMYQCAPLPEDLHDENADDWVFPVIADSV